jgi:hypothetical protein
MDYLRTFKLGLDVAALEQSCNELSPFIIDKFSGVEGKNYDGESSATTKLFSRYNLLMYPLPQIHQLYEGIRSAFRSVNAENPYFIQCWLNAYNKDEYIDWHSHWDPKDNVWHGYYTVKGEGTITSYRIPNEEQFDMINKVDQLVLGPSDGDEHRTYPEGNRITIAFDIVPAWNINYKEPVNHWIPI